jgi:hypothetical protein
MGVKTDQRSVSAVSLQEFNEIWERISEDVANSFKMDEAEKERFKNKDIAKLIAAIPILAGCENAERTAVSHLGVYVLSNRETKHYFNPTVSDNKGIFERLKHIGNFTSGDPWIIKKGMNLIALTMLNDYKRDIHIDETLGKYNPVGENSFDYHDIKDKLKAQIASIECYEMDQIYNDGSTEAYWGH